MSDLPDRDEVLPSVFDDDLRTIGFAYVRGELKTRDEMDEENALWALNAYIDGCVEGRWVLDPGEMSKIALDAAWEAVPDE